MSTSERGNAEVATVLRAARLVAAKDLRLEARTRVATAQMLPFALLVLLLFAFALDPDRGVLTDATGGLFWTTVLFTSVLAIQRAYAIEMDTGDTEVVLSLWEQVQPGGSYTFTALGATLPAGQGVCVSDRTVAPLGAPGAAVLCSVHSIKSFISTVTLQ